MHKKCSGSATTKSEEDRELILWCGIAQALCKNGVTVKCQSSSPGLNRLQKRRILCPQTQHIFCSWHCLHAWDLPCHRQAYRLAKSSCSSRVSPHGSGYWPRHHTMVASECVKAGLAFPAMMAKKGHWYFDRLR